MTAAEFEAMLEALADAWSRRDYGGAAAWFSPTVRYADPLRYAFADRAALQAFFEADGGLLSGPSGTCGCSTSGASGGSPSTPTRAPTGTTAWR